METIDGSQKSLRLGFTLIVLSLTACAGSPPSDLGLRNNALAPCPSSPNCVSSYSESENHRVSPWVFDGKAEEAHEKLLTLLKNMDNTTLIKVNPNYIRVEFKSALMGFVDDVEFVIEEDTVQMRSASRLGYSDLGANKKRIEALKDAFVPCCD